MTKTQKSSRNRMQNRMRRYIKSAPRVYYILHPTTQKEIQCANRALRRKQDSIKRKHSNANE